MIKTKRLRELFEVSWLMMRQNPGGKSPYMQGYLLGFNGTVDLAAAFGTAAKADLKIKVGNGDVRRLSVALNGIIDVDSAKSALNSALDSEAVTDCVFDEDEKTKRLRLKPVGSNVRFIQIWGDLAAALQFGDCRFNEGRGCYLWASMDGDLKSVAETENWEEDKTIENESPFGTKVTYTVRGKRENTQIVVADRIASREAKQMINGGRWIAGDADTPEMYEPPHGGSNKAGKVDVFTYSKIMDKFENIEGDEAYVRERLYIGGTGRMARTGGAGSWTDSEYTLTFNTYTDDEGRDHASPRESDYTIMQWDKFELSGVIVDDWANA